MGTPGKAVLLPSGKRGLLPSGKAALYDPDGKCLACCGTCGPCVLGSYRFQACIDYYETIMFGTGTNGIPCRYIQFGWDAGTHFDCNINCPDLPSNLPYGAIIDGVYVPLDMGTWTGRHLLGGTMNYTPGAIVTITKHAGRGPVTWDAANRPSASDSRLRTCNECPGRPSCAVRSSGDCRGRAYLRRPLACCPLEEQRWSP